MSIVSDRTRLLLAFSMLKGVGPAALRKVAAHEAFKTKDLSAIAAAFPQIARAQESTEAWSRAQENAEKQVEEARFHDARILSICDPEYPKLLSSTKDDPAILYVQGNLSPNPHNSVAIIGTREPTAHGEVIAVRITQFFVEAGWSIVSGLAIGCDAIAHRAALDANGHTVAVLAHGLQTVAPARHKQLAADILSAGGALVSEYPFGQGVQKQNYVKRDRTQAGMAQGVVMIQSDLKGGSLHASRASLDYNRWLAVPYPTEKDRENREPKVQANLAIAEGAESQRADLLRCSVSSLNRIVILRSRADYMILLKTGSPLNENADYPQDHSVTESSRTSSRDRLVDAQLEFSSELNPKNDLDKTPAPGEASLPSHHPGPMGSSSASAKEIGTDHVICEVGPYDIRICRNPSHDVNIFSLSQEQKNRLHRQLPEGNAISILGVRLRYIENKICSIRNCCRGSHRSAITLEDSLVIQIGLEDAARHMNHILCFLENHEIRVRNSLSSLEKSELSTEVPGNKIHILPSDALPDIPRSAHFSKLLSFVDSFSWDFMSSSETCRIEIDLDDLVCHFNELLTAKIASQL